MNSDDAKTPDSPLTREDRRFLLALARAVIDAGVVDASPPTKENQAEGMGYAIPDSLMRNRGVFVTLNRDGALRGCIGYIQGVRPLADAVIDNARAAAFEDPRFPPLDETELPGLSIEISVLSPLRSVGSYADIVIPGHGVVLQKAGRKSVFLPQVAEEQGWDRDTCLTQLSLKAGLPPEAWRNGATFEVFDATSLTEDEI